MSEIEKESQANKPKDHEITIIVNATQHTVEDKDVTYLEIVQLGFPGAVIDRKSVV